MLPPLFLEPDRGMIRIVGSRSVGRLSCISRDSQSNWWERIRSLLIRSGYLFWLFHFVERAIRCLEQGFDGYAIIGINRNADAH